MPEPPPFTPYDNPYSYIPPASYNDPQPRQKKKRTWLTALCFSLIGSLLGAGALLLGERLFTPSPEEVQLEQQTMTSQLLIGQREQVALETVPVGTGEEMTPAQVYAQNVRSTVGITTTLTTTNFWGYQTTSAASGSGFIISPDGYILTNFHVIEGSDSISVSLFDDRTYEAKLIGYDESNDIAVLKVDASNLPPVILGDSDKLNVGDTVVAIGNPLGELTFSLTSGSVSAKDRDVTFSGSISMKL
ncbi:MAG: trypsin-like peptidase domain-containing protein, partial [Oscillospiraceae bacterium]|nr:trypsin-like peptidase domain-containing protein [Oscillospiraceae bacterium]